MIYIQFEMFIVDMYKIPELQFYEMPQLITLPQI